jgi:apolipoprotein N-acyltransferase
MIRLLNRMAGLPAAARGLLALVCGVMAALGLPPFGLWPIAFLGVSLFLMLVEGVKRTNWRSGFGAGWLFGLGYFAVAFHWIGFAFLVEAATYLWMMPFMLGILAGGMAIYWGLAAWAARRWGGTGLALVLFFAAAIGVAEWLRGHLFTGFPWAAPGLMVDGMGGTAQLAALTGMPALTVLIIVWAGLPYALLRAGSNGLRIAVIALGVLLPLAWGWGSWRLAGAGNEMVGGISFRIVQPNIPQQEKWREDNARVIFDTLIRLSSEPTAANPRGISGVTHLVWPESAVPFLIDESPAARAELEPMLGGHTALITGALRLNRKGDAEPDVFNSIIVFDGNAEPMERYDKWRLVPGGEFLPLEWLLEPLGFRKVVATPGSFTAGPGPRTLALPGGLSAALLVCYEMIFPDRLIDPVNRPQLIVNVTNDGWFGRSTGPYQHVAQVRLRAIEQGLPVIRAANTGVSAVLDPFGRYLQQLPLMEQGVIDSPLPAAVPPTPYARLGDWALLMLLAAAFGSSFLAGKTTLR